MVLDDSDGVTPFSSIGEDIASVLVSRVSTLHAEDVLVFFATWCVREIFVVQVDPAPSGVTGASRGERSRI